MLLVKPRLITVDFIYNLPTTVPRPGGHSGGPRHLGEPLSPNLACRRGQLLTSSWVS